jgi:hypothetical protein
MCPKHPLSVYSRTDIEAEFGKSGIKTYRWDLPGQRNILGKSHLALIKRALKIRLSNGVATIGFLVDQSDQAILDLQMHLKALLDLVLESACGLDAEGLTTVVTLASMLRRTCAIRGARTAWVGWGPDPPSRSSGCRRLGRRRSRAGCRRAPCTLP